ncbi:MAG: DNA cytosine methyltransferase [Tepidisphaeraceae bacterium]|jgi:DNA (cytosine-5)-methyltransferase 1
MARPIGIEIFCGVGGMSLGFEQAGFHVAAAFDSDPLNVEYHQRNFPRTLTYEADVTDLSGREILKKSRIDAGKIDVLFGGPPCQGFSVIGQRRNGDHRNLLILEFARLVRELRPRYFVVENVRGLLYSYSKPILDSFLRRVRRTGYEVVAPIRTLDSSCYGVPQKRKRVFILGYLRGLPIPDYPQPTSLGGKAGQTPTVAHAIGDLPQLIKFNELLTTDAFEGALGPASEYARMLRGELVDPGDLSYKRSHSYDGLSGCARTAHSPATVEKFSATPPGTYEPTSRCYRLRLDGLANTLRAGTGPLYGSFTAARPIHPTEPRCISTREAARLQSFPDWFEFHPTKWHGFRQVGNAVPPLLAKAVATGVKDAICRM